MKESKSLVSFTAIENESKVERIANRIINAIIEGELLPGQKIPTEAELSDSLNVGRNSVREAIKSLEAMGILIIKRSEGTFVADGFSNKMLDPMLYGLILEGGNSTLMIELRKVFETGTLKLAVEKATSEDIQELKEIFKELKEQVTKTDDPKTILYYDEMFHDTITKFARNPLIEKTNMMIVKLCRPSRISTHRSIIEDNRVDEFINKHQHIIDIFENREVVSVGQCMDEHFDYWKEQLEHNKTSN